MLNQVQLIGNLGADPEIRTFPDGGRVASLRIATAERWKDRATGERKERTEWHSVSVHASPGSSGLVGVVEQYCRKGGKLFVQGQLRTRKWQDRDGNDRYTTEIVLGPRGVLTLLGDAGGGREGGGQRPAPAPAAGTAGAGFGLTPPPGLDNDLDDDVPF